VVVLSRLALLVVLSVTIAKPVLGQTHDTSLQVLLDRYEKEPTNAMLCERIGVEYARLNSFDKAATFFRKAVALDPGRIPALKNLATVLWFSGKKGESASIFRSLEKRIPDDPVPQLYLGLSNYDQKNMEEAARHFERAGTLVSDNPETFPVLIETYLITGRSAAALPLLEQRLASGNLDSQTYRWLGDAYDGQSRPEASFKAYSTAIDKYPNEEANYLAFAAFSIEHANLSFAREILERGLTQTPGSPKLLLELGLAWALEGNFEKAKQSFANANTADASWSLPLLALGITALQGGDAGLAAEWFRKAEAAAPNDYRCYYLHAVALKRTASGNEGATRAIAISELKRAMALNPQQAKVRIALAEMEIADGKTAAAESNLREAIRLEPGASSALYKLATLCRREGKTQEAERFLQAFQQSKDKSKSDENEFVLMLKTVE
jgi:tetratricopeptide (TPR) repeat protein